MQMMCTVTRDLLAQVSACMQCKCTFLHSCTSKFACSPPCLLAHACVTWNARACWCMRAVTCKGRERERDRKKEGREWGGFKKAQQKLTCGLCSRHHSHHLLLALPLHSLPHRTRLHHRRLADRGEEVPGPSVPSIWCSLHAAAAATTTSACNFGCRTVQVSQA